MYRGHSYYIGWRPSLLGWTPSLLGGRPSLFGWISGDSWGSGQTDRGQEHARVLGVTWCNGYTQPICVHKRRNGGFANLGRFQRFFCASKCRAVRNVEDPGESLSVRRQAQVRLNITEAGSRPNHVSSPEPFPNQLTAYPSNRLIVLEWALFLWEAACSFGVQRLGFPAQHAPNRKEVPPSWKIIF